jgi:endoglucanase
VKPTGKHDAPGEAFSHDKTGLEEPGKRVVIMKSILALNHLMILGTLLFVSSAFADPDTQNAFTPANPQVMQPIARGDACVQPGGRGAAYLLVHPAKRRETPAYQAARWFRRGVNLGDYLEADRSCRQVTVSAGEIARMKQEGFDHVRVPVGWHQYAGPGPEFKLEPEIFSLVDFVVTNALQDRLAVMINIHHFNSLDRNPSGATAEFLAIWRQVAEHYRQFPRQLAFELDNEPHEKATTAAMNSIYVESIGEIRQSNPSRTIFVEPGNWGSIEELKNLVLPPDENVIVSVHCYDPFLFTHQGASWTSGATPVIGIIFPGPPAQPLVPDPEVTLKDYQLDWVNKYNTLPPEKNPSGPVAFAGKLQYIRAWSDYYGRPVHLGEFGAYTKADGQSRANFYAAFRVAAERQKIGWCIWDWSANFRYWDKPNDRPMPGMHEALFGRSE